MTATPNMGLVLPVDHGSADVWDTILDAVFLLVDAHDHTTGKGVKVPISGLNVNADLAFGGTLGPVNMGYADFTPIAASAVTGLADALFVNSTDSNNLYFRNHSGVNVKITDGSTLNVSIVGGIGGDYSSVGALLSFDDATDSYWLQQQGSPRPWARIRVGDLDVYQTAASISNRVRIKSPAALAASYDVTLPTALPASAMGLAIDNTGAMTAGASFAMLSNASITLSGSGSFVLSGTGNFKHGTRSISKSLFPSMANVSAGTVNSTGGSAGVALANNTIAYFPLPELPQHARIVNVNVYFNSSTDRTNTTCVLYGTSTADPATTTFTSIATLSTNVGTAISQATGVNQTPTGSRTYFVQMSNSATTPKIQAIVVDYDIP